MRGPTNRAMASAVIAARMPRSVRYWKTWKPEYDLARYSVRYNNMVFWLSSRGERLHDALQPIDARSLDEHRHTGRQLRLQASNQCIGVGKPFAARAESLDGAGALRPHREQPLHAAIACIAAHLGVQIRRLPAQFGHIGKHQ